MFLRKVTAGRAEATARLAGRLQAATSTLTAAAARMRGSNTAAVARRSSCRGHCPTLRYLPLWWQKNPHQKMEALEALVLELEVLRLECPTFGTLINSTQIKR